MNPFEKNRIVTREYTVPVTDKANLPDHPFRVAVLSDLHDHVFPDGGRDLLERIEKARPAAVLCAGDMVTARDGRYELDHAQELVCTIARKFPVYLSDGNHELRMRELPDNYDHVYEKYTQAIENAGAKVLYNQTVHIKVCGMKIALTGYGQPLCTYNRIHPAVLGVQDLEERIGKADPTRFNILLAHYPDPFEAYMQWGADLAISGHVHGGIIRLPFIGGVVGSGLKPFPKYDRGCYKQGKGAMVVSAGLGCHTIPIRFLNPPELVVIRIGAEDGTVI